MNPNVFIIQFHSLWAHSKSSSYQFSHSFVSNSLWPHGLQYSRLSNPQRLLRLMSMESVMPCNHLILCHPLLLPHSIFPSIRVFSSESVLCIKWPKYWSFSFSISPSNEYSGLISFRVDWLDFLAVQGTLKSLLQHHSSKASILWHSAFFTVQLSHPYMTTGKTISLTRRTFVGKVMSLLLNTLLAFNKFSLWVEVNKLPAWTHSPGSIDVHGGAWEPNRSVFEFLLSCSVLLVNPRACPSSGYIACKVGMLLYLQDCYEN